MESVFGIGLNSHSGCLHYRTEKDVVAIRMKCCRKFYACILCHNQLESHEPQKWKPTEFSEKAVLCRNCGRLLTIREYLESKFQCPGCGTTFNPGCRKHYHFYFRVNGSGQNPKKSTPDPAEQAEKIHFQ